MLRINLGFNEEDSKQYEAYMLLKAHNRKKAEYVSDLIIADENRKASEENVESEEKPLSDADIRKIVREELDYAVNEIVSKIMENLADGNVEIKTSESKKSSKNSKKSEKPAEPEKKEPEAVPESFYEENSDVIDSMLSSMPNLFFEG